MAALLLAFVELHGHFGQQRQTKTARALNIQPLWQPHCWKRRANCTGLSALLREHINLKRSPIYFSHLRWPSRVVLVGDDGGAECDAERYDKRRRQHDRHDAIVIRSVQLVPAKARASKPSVSRYNVCACLESAQQQKQHWQILTLERAEHAQRSREQYK